MKNLERSARFSVGIHSPLSLEQLIVRADEYGFRILLASQYRSKLVGKINKER